MTRAMDQDGAAMESALALLKEERFAEGDEALRRLYAQGVERAALVLGYMHHRALGMPAPRPATAIRWYRRCDATPGPKRWRRAAAFSVARTIVEVTERHARGAHPQRVQTAIRILEGLIAEGDRNATLYLGIHYAKHRPGTPEYARGTALLRDCARAGFINAKIHLSRIEQQAGNPVRMIWLRLQAAIQGVILASFHHGDDRLFLMRYSDEWNVSHIKNADD